MADYQHGLIYKIVSNKTEKIYIGSTINLEQRWKGHKTDYKLKNYFLVIRE